MIGFECIPAIAGLLMRPPPTARWRWAMVWFVRLVEPPPVLTESGCRGVFVPVLTDDAGATKLPGESFSSVGIPVESNWFSLLRSRILISKRLT